MSLFCQFLAFSTISLSFATLLFKQHHCRSGEVDKWFYISVNQFVTFDMLVLSGVNGLYCDRLPGATLARPQRTEETEVISDGVATVSEIQLAAPDLDPNADARLFYINVYDGDKDGIWRTINGTEVTHFDWSPGQPNNMNNIEYCVMISGKPNHQGHRPLVWYDYKCDTLAGFVCEISVSAINFKNMEREFECGTSFCPSTGLEKAGISQLRCARLCSRDSSCRGMKFNHSTQTCVLAVDGSEFDLDAAIEEETVCCMKI